MNEGAAHSEITFEIISFSWDDGLMMWAREPRFDHPICIEIPEMTANFRRRMAETGQTRHELLAELNSRLANARMRK